MFGLAYLLFGLQSACRNSRCDVRRYESSFEVEMDLALSDGAIAVERSDEL